MRRNASLALGALVMALAGWGIHAAGDWPWKAKLFPLAIGIPLFLMAAAEVVLLLLGRTPQGDVPDFQPDREQPTAVVVRRTLVTAGWILALLAGIVLIGFPVAVPLFVFLYLKLQGRESWKLAAVFAVSVWLVLHGLFERLLHLPFPAGWLQGWLGLA